MRGDFSREQLRALQHRVNNMLQRGVVDTVDDALKLQYMNVKLRGGEEPTQVERFQEYGFTSVPRSGATEVLVLNVGGNRDHPIIIKSDDRTFRLKGQKPGEVAIYDDLGQSVVLGRDNITMKSPTKVVVDCPDVNLGGDGGTLVALCGGGCATRVKAV